MTKLLSFIALTLVTVTAGCVDPAGRLDEFYDNTEDFRLTVVAGPCQGRNDISGEYLLSIATVIRPTAPILLSATFAVDSSVEPWTIDLTMTPLATEDRALVGDALHASSTVNEDGTFDFDFGEIQVLSAANPIIPADATATLQLSGCTNGFGFSCGTVDGAITSPAALALTGSNYGAIAVEPGELETVEPVSACPE